MDEVGEHRRRLVPARVVVELRALVEAEGEVVIGTDPLGGVDGAGLESRRNLAARQVDDVGARSFEDRAAEAGNAHLEALEVLQRADLLVEPAASRSEEHTSELQSLMRIPYAVFC